MSRKTVQFKMPARAPSLGRERQAPVQPRGDREGEASASSGLDRWVQQRETIAQADPETVGPTTLTPLGKGLSIDVTADRELWQVVALILIVPPLLNWFWMLNSTSRFWNAFR